jgi:hypothetical protein
MYRQSGKRGERANLRAHALHHQSSTFLEIALKLGSGPLTFRCVQYYRRAGPGIHIRANMDEETTGWNGGHVAERPPEGRHTTCEDTDVRIQFNLARKSGERLLEALCPGITSGHNLGSVTSG